MADPRSGRRYQAFKSRIRLAHAEQLRPCALCGQAIDYRLGYPHPHSWSLDHRQAIHAGGATFDPSNCQASHLTCNASRGATEGNAKRRTPTHTSVRW